MRLGNIPRRLTLPTSALLAVAALLAFIQASPAPLPASAGQSDSTIQLVAVDARPDRTPANTPTSFGSIETCVETKINNEVKIDVVVDSIPLDRPLAAFQFNLLYDPSIVNVTGLDMAQLLASVGDSYRPVDFLSETVPDGDGSFTPAVADFSGNNEVGPGVLARITLTAINNGISKLQVDNVPHGSPVIGDDQSEEIPVQKLAAARVAVGESCEVAEQTPLAPVVIFTPTTTPQDGSGTPAADGSPSAGTPSAGTPSAGTPSAGTATPQGTPAGEDGRSEDNGDGDGFPYWVIALAAGAAVLGGGGFVLARRYRRRGG